MRDLLFVTLAAGAAVFLSTAVFLFVRAERRRRAGHARLQPALRSLQAQLGELEARRSRDEIDPESYEEQRRGLASQLLEASGAAGAGHGDGVHGTTRWLAPVALAVGIGMAVVAGFVRQEETAAPVAHAPGDAGSRSEAASADKSRNLKPEQLERMVEQVSAQLEKNPKDAPAWSMLAHSYEMLGKFDESSKAYAKLVELLPNDAQVFADYADTLAVAQGGHFSGEPTRLIQKALSLDPANLKALALAGGESFRDKQYAQAAGYWERALKVSKDPAFSKQLADDVAEARAFAEGAAAPHPAGSASVSGRVSLSAEVKARASPDDTLFIFARPEGARMPVALLRKRVSDLPLEFTLDDSAAMVADMNLSKLGTVVVGARISKRGDAAPHAGDLQGFSAPVRVGSKGVSVEIRDVVQ